MTNQPSTIPAAMDSLPLAAGFVACSHASYVDARAVGVGRRFIDHLG